MRQITQLEYSLIESKVKAVANSTGIKNPSTCFLHLVLDSLFPRLEEDISSLITDGSNDRGADAVYIQEQDNRAYVAILQSKHARKLNNAKKNFPGGEVDKLLSLIRDICEKPENVLDTVNSVLREKIRDIWRLIDSGKTISFRIFMVSNALPLVELERERLNSFCKQYNFVSFEELPFSRIINLIASDNRPRESGALNCVDLQRYERIDCDIRGLIANVDATSFIKMISTSDGESIKRHLFDENIRGFLGLDGGFNQQIFQSALSEENHLFWYLNNGITIVAKDFEHQKIRGSIIKLEDFQIVNGAQTSYSLFEALKKDQEKLSEVVLLVKIFASNRPDLSERIAIATNSQARIAPRDLKANDAIQKKIEAVFRDHGLLYERKKHQYDDSHVKLPKIDSLKLGQSIWAYHLGEPHLPRTASDEIFGNMYNLIFSETLDGDFLAKLAKLYLIVSEDRSFELEESRRSTATSENRGFAAYTQWHILYTISLLAKAEDLAIPEEAELQNYLDKAKLVVAKIATQNKSHSYYRIFRSSQTKEHIRQELGLGQLQFDY